ncbi:hypothetical protein CDL15_Pgr024062 [Punica granatum]|uniref:Uncharacterized protein n=1 Tax=Punica granatum TaxID=22663 RepID=A0A218XW81_PUNGR|nr:hypothetical protein CDL15_Pgr024062 [Punica granatum]
MDITDVLSSLLPKSGVVLDLRKFTGKKGTRQPTNKSWQMFSAGSGLDLLVRGSSSTFLLMLGGGDDNGLSFLLFMFYFPGGGLHSELSRDASSTHPIISSFQVLFTQLHL